MASAGMAIAPSNKRTIRSVPNPLDKATIVSIYPRRIVEYKYTIQPGVFDLAAGSEEHPSLTVVGPSSWWRDIGEEMPLIEIPNGAIQVAESVINDWANGLLMCDMDSSMPGIFFVPGELTIEKIRADYSDALKTAVAKQKNWFQNLIKLADHGWAQTNGSPRAISDLMRIAAEALNLKDRDWMRNFVEITKIQCAACGNLRNPAYPVCSSCNRIVDIPLAKKLGIIENPTVK